MRKCFLGIFFLGLAILLNSCSSKYKMTDYEGLTTPYGKPLGHIHVSRLAFHLLGKFSVVGNASINKTTTDFLNEAKALGAKKVLIEHTERTSYWFGFPPFTLLITPVITSVSGTALPE